MIVKKYLKWNWEVKSMRVPLRAKLCVFSFYLQCSRKACNLIPGKHHALVREAKESGEMFSDEESENGHFKLWNGICKMAGAQKNGKKCSLQAQGTIFEKGERTVTVFAFLHFVELGH